jgi:hypothetical protein
MVRLSFLVAAEPFAARAWWHQDDELGLRRQLLFAAALVRGAGDRMRGAVRERDAPT